MGKLDQSIRSAFNRIKTGSGTNEDIKTLLRDHFLQEKQRMTLPYERMNSLLAAERLLYDLMDPKATSRVPREIRGRARSVLRHWPMSHDFELIAERVPERFNTSTDPLYTAVKQYDNSK